MMRLIFVPLKIGRLNYLLKLLFVAEDVSAVPRFIFAREEDCDAGESGLDSVRCGILHLPGFGVITEGPRAEPNLMV